MTKNPILNVGIDGRVLQGNRSGVGRYVFELCQALEDWLPEARFFIYSQQPIEMPIQSDRWISRVDPLRWAKALKPILWLKVRAGALCAQDPLQVFWGTASFLPSLAPQVRTVVTIHDLVFRLAPETMALGNLWANRLFFQSDLRRADVVLANSAGTAARVRQQYGRSTQAIVRPAINAAFSPRSELEVQSCLQQYQIRQPYFLAVATWNPRKNLERLIEAFLLAQADCFPNHCLVIAGERGWKDQAVSSLLQGETGQKVMGLGFVPEPDLPSLYSGATALVYPSLYEGFGIPVVEALACGTPVIASDIPEIREAGGAHPIYIKPTVAGIVQGFQVLAQQRPTQPAVAAASWHENAKGLALALRGELDQKELE